MWLLTLILFFLEHSFAQTVPLYLRKTTVSNKYMHTLSLSLNHIFNSQYYGSWNITLTTYNYSEYSKSNLQFLYATSINSISSGVCKSGIQINVAKIYQQKTTLTLQNVTFANKQAHPMIWISQRIFIFLLPKDVPFMITAVKHDTNLTNGSYKVQFFTDKIFAETCFYDSTKTIKDKVYLLPSLSNMFIENPKYVNLTSKSNFIYELDENRTFLTFYLNYYTYTSRRYFIAIEVMALCPNSFKFAQYNLSMGISDKNWFSFQPTNSIGNKYRSVLLQYPFSNDTNVMMGMGITGLSFQSLKSASFSNIFVSFNISQGYDSNGGYMSYLGNLSYNIINPLNCYGFYWMFGQLGACPSNLIQYNKTHCICPSGTTLSQTSGSCIDCKLLFDETCGSCNLAKCLGCISGLYLYKTAKKQICLNCTKLYGLRCRQCSERECLKCDNNFTLKSKCLQCDKNFKLINNTCQCLGLGLTFSNFQCMRCQDLKDSSSSCNATVRLESYQSGNTLYFWFKQDEGRQQILFRSSVQFNVVVKSNGSSMSFLYRQQTGIFVTDLSGLHQVSYLRVQLLNQHQTITNGSYTPTTFSVSPVQATAYFSEFIRSLAIVRNYAIVATLLFCFGVFHKLSKSLTIVLVMCLTQSNLPNSLGVANDILHINSPFEWVNVQLGWDLPILECDQLRFVAYGFNESVINLAFELYIVGIASALLIAFVRGYLQTKLRTKQKAERHFAWRNILAHSREYLLQNILNLHALLGFPAILQLKLIISQGSVGIIKNIANFLSATYLLAMPCLLITLCLLKYWYRSVVLLFNSLTRTRLTVALWIMTTLHPYLTCIASLFVTAPLNLYLIMAFNGLLLVLWGMCLNLARSKVNYVSDLVKQGCVLYLSVSLLFNSEDGSVLKVALFCVLMIVCVELFQILFKTVMLVLVNKRIIKSDTCSSAEIDEEKPIKLEPQSRGE